MAIDYPRYWHAPEIVHACNLGPLKDPSAGGRRPAPEDWGQAITTIGRLDGIWWAISGSPPEYATRIRYCPWCGVELE